MAENTPPSTEEPDLEATPAATGRARFTIRRAAGSAPAKRTAITRAERRASGKPHPVRSFLTVAAVAGMVATVAIPAVSAARSSSAEAMTLEQVAAENAQSLVVASEASPAALERENYAATTPEEIEEMKAKEAAEAAAQAALAARLATNNNAAAATAIASSIAVSGNVVRPLTHFNNFGTPYAGHKGTDYMVAGGTPIYAMADGVVVASSESGPGWGVYVKIAHNIGGTSVTSLYAHMTYGTRAVQVGDTVSAGQLIGQVGATGRAFGTHLHLEIYVGGAWTNAESFLATNAG